MPDRKWFVLSFVAILALVAIWRRGQTCEGCQQRKARLKEWLGNA